MKGLIIAAGYGTRFLPATKTIPKEMLPLIDKPTIAFIVEEFLRSGIRNIVIVTSRRKKALEDYFDRDPELEAVFEKEGARAKLDQVRPCDANVCFVRQQAMMGTGHALLIAKQAIGNEPFIVAYPDDLHFGEPPLAKQLIDVHAKTGCSVLATLHNPPELHRYGVLALNADGRHVADIVEKPPKGAEPSREASIGRYLYTPDIFDALEEGWKKHAGGEYYHVYALKKLMDARRVVYHPIQGERLDIGAPSGYLRAILRYARENPELAAVLKEELGK